jgi:hypothetical protein
MYHNNVTNLIHFHLHKHVQDYDTIKCENILGWFRYWDIISETQVDGFGA